MIINFDEYLKKADAVPLAAEQRLFLSVLKQLKEHWPDWRQKKHSNSKLIKQSMEFISEAESLISKPANDDNILVDFQIRFQAHLKALDRKESDTHLWGYYSD